MERSGLEKNHAASFIAALLLALAAHLLLLPPLASWMIPSDKLPTTPESRRVRLMVLGPEARGLALARLDPPAPAAVAKPAEVKKAEEEKNKELKGQIVDLPPSADNTPPEDAKYLSEHNTRTERETRSRHQAPVLNNVMNEPTITRKTEEKV